MHMHGRTPKLPAGVVFDVYNGKGNKMHHVRSEHVLFTALSTDMYDAVLKNRRQRYIRPQMCFHFKTKGYCAFGESCNFMHVLFWE